MKNAYHHGDLKNALIQAGFEILAEEGVQGLSLRKAAKKAGVSHAAPYAHFPDKGSLIAEIAARGYQDLYNLVLATSQKYQAEPLNLLVETALVYIQYAVENPHQFKITFSGIVAKEAQYPAYVDVSKKSFLLVVNVVRTCQEAGILNAGDAELLAVSIWAGVHGLATLLLDNQIPSQLLERQTLREILLAHLSQAVLVEIPGSTLASNR